MIGTTISHYRIIEKLGEGGMGVVYKAEDTRLDRTVALKFLPHHLTAQEADRARFLQEAKAAAALNHPNVCSVIDIQEADGQQFIVMEYVDGITLRSKLPVRKLDEALTYAIQIGEALTEAHAKGIVHRDVKVDNIMVNARNQIKVMDFGLAKLKGSLKLTKTSSTVGTLAYMAPEQIQGGEVDARSDIFSFGVVLFEMLTGRTPFRGEHEAAIMYSILNEEPESVRTSRPDVREEVERIIMRALEKDPADRYQHADDMVSELRRSLKQSTRVVRPDAAGVKPTGDSGVSQVRKPIPMIWIAAAAVVVIVAAGVIMLLRGGFSTGTGGGRKMLAVLPFENLGSPDQEYFADGITEEITSRLSGLSGLGVIARSSAMQYKKTTKTIKQIGGELGVSYILQGTVRWEDVDGVRRVRVNPQLINVADETQIWSHPSEVVMASVFKIQADIAEEVAGALNVTLLQHEKQSLAAAPTENSEAYDYYLQGNEHIYLSTQESDYRIAEQMLERAVAIDPNFAKAYAKLGALYSHMYWEYYDHTDERVRKAKAAAERALQLDPSLPDAHGAMGWYYYHCLRDYPNAIKEFSTALSAQPNNVDLLLGLGSIYRRQGDFGKALIQFNLAQQIDPRSPGMIGNAAETDIFLRNYAEAHALLNHTISLAPSGVDWYCDKAMIEVLWHGDVAQAERFLDTAVQNGVDQNNLFFAYVRLWLGLLSGNCRPTIERVNGLNVRVFTYQSWYIPRDLLLAQLMVCAGEKDQARSHYDAARILLEGEARRNPDDSRISSSLGLVYAGLGRKEDAIREGKRAVGLMPISRDAIEGLPPLENLARIYASVGEADAAIEILRNLLSTPSDLSAAFLRLDPSLAPLRDNPRFQKLLAENP